MSEAESRRQRWSENAQEGCSTGLATLFIACALLVLRGTDTGVHGRTLDAVVNSASGHIFWLSLTGLAIALAFVGTVAALAGWMTLLLADRAPDSFFEDARERPWLFEDEDEQA